jgi:hypothetical protein
VRFDDQIEYFLNRLFSRWQNSMLCELPQRVSAADSSQTPAAAPCEQAHFPTDHEIPTKSVRF